ncbi:MAG: ArsC/Spx/MgsR family protein [Bacillota bacterium]|nr:ArsC/Spx/MgsR family protein [Bacillota bacterium]MDW7684518.1 ArsC/Spx/MgsR family protein [Bacillota bacterium]
MINPKSTAFKALKVSAESLSTEKAAEIIAANPKAMFRPLFTDGQHVVVGFKPEEMTTLFT